MRILGTVASSSREVPNAPTIGTATNVGSGRAFNNGRADVTFTAPTFNGGLPILDYTVTSSPGGFTATGASSPLTVTGLQSSTSYTFTVRARNAVGTGPASAASNSITATTVPQAPTIGTATDGGTGSTATVAYTANATGGSAITTFTATSSPGSLTGTGASPITVSGLTAGTAYTFTVTATNANGTSVASAASNSVTPAVPVSFESIATINGNGSSATITFSSIPSTYKSLQIRIIGKDTGTSSFSGIPGIRFNGDAAFNYSVHSLSGSGSSATSNGFATRTYIDSAGNRVVPDSNYTNVMWAGIINIIDYASTSKNKTVRWFDGANSNGESGYDRVELVSGAWYSTSAVNSISIILVSGNAWTSTSTFALYGVK